MCNDFVFCGDGFSFQGSYWTIDTCPDISRKRRHPPDDDVSPHLVGRGCFCSTCSFRILSCIFSPFLCLGQRRNARKVKPWVLGGCVVATYRFCSFTILSYLKTRQNRRQARAHGEAFQGVEKPHCLPRGILRCHFRAPHLSPATAR